MLGFAYWLLKPSVEDATKKYHINFDESVLGLNIDSAVKYRGINVGKVTGLRINPKNSEQVEVLVTILKTTPIKETTVAKLTSQGITGLSYINLSMGNNGALALKAKAGEKYPVIKTEDSFFERFEKSLGTVSTKLSQTLTRTSELLNEENQKQIALLLTKAASFMGQMEKLMNDKAIANLHSSIKNIDTASNKFDAMLPKVEYFIDKSVAWEDKISTSFSSISKSYLGIKSSMDIFKGAISNGEFNIKEITSDVMPTLNSTLLEMQHFMISIENVLNQYERSPGDILYKQEEIKKGPGEN
ncbi:MAG: MCE family protein [Epsilonproteobacteria bacterium]|nr:MAG: MCE family protein [Campylobacterota bacterium]